MMWWNVQVAKRPGGETSSEGAKRPGGGAKRQRGETSINQLSNDAKTNFDPTSKDNSKNTSYNELSFTTNEQQNLF